MSKPCPHCGRAVLAIGCESCDACLARSVTGEAAPPTKRARWSPMSEPVTCRVCLRPFVRRTAVQRRCPDCCRDGRGGARYVDGKKVPRRRLWGEDGQPA